MSRIFLGPAIQWLIIIVLAGLTWLAGTERVHVSHFNLFVSVIHIKVVQFRIRVKGYSFEKFFYFRVMTDRPGSFDGKIGQPGVKSRFELSGFFCDHDKFDQVNECIKGQHTLIVQV